MSSFYHRKVYFTICSVQPISFGFTEPILVTLKMVNRLRYIDTSLCYNTNFQGKKFSDFRFVSLQVEAFAVLFLKKVILFQQIPK